MIVFRTFRFHSARYLPKLKDNHICKKMHGHTFNLTVYVDGEINTQTGFVIDFYDIDTVVNKLIISKIDHKILNEIDGLENPTSEIVSKWIGNHLNPSLKGLSKIELSEDHGTGIIYKGE